MSYVCTDQDWFHGSTMLPKSTFLIPSLPNLEDAAIELHQILPFWHVALPGQGLLQSPGKSEVQHPSTWKSGPQFVPYGPRRSQIVTRHLLFSESLDWQVFRRPAAATVPSLENQKVLSSVLFVWAHLCGSMMFKVILPCSSTLFSVFCFLRLTCLISCGLPTLNLDSASAAAAMFSPQLLERQTGSNPVTGESTIIPAKPNFKHSRREGRKNLDK